MVLMMFFEVDQGHPFFAKPTEGMSSRRHLPLRPPMFVLHVPQHIESVQVVQVHALQTGHLFVRPEHDVLYGGVLRCMAFKV